MACRNVIGEGGTVEPTTERFSRDGGRIAHPVMVVRGARAVVMVDVEAWAAGADVCMGAACLVVAAAG
jgi:hypothetical protein